MRRNRIERPGHARPRRDPLGLGHRLQGTSPVALSVTDPCRHGKARGQRLGISQLPAQGDTFGGPPRGGIQIVSLVQHFCHTQEGQAGGRQRPPGLGGDLHCLLAGVQRRAQVAPGLPDLAQVAGSTHGKIELARGLLPGKESRQCRLGLRQPAAQPVSHGQVPVDLETQRLLVRRHTGPGLPCEGTHPCGVPMPSRDLGAPARSTRARSPRGSPTVRPTAR